MWCIASLINMIQLLFFFRLSQKVWTKRGEAKSPIRTCTQASRFRQWLNVIMSLANSYYLKIILRISSLQKYSQNQKKNRKYRIESSFVFEAAFLPPKNAFCIVLSCLLYVRIYTILCDIVSDGAAIPHYYFN